jgi:hypothetical protein
MVANPALGFGAAGDPGVQSMAMLGMPKTTLNTCAPNERGERFAGEYT